MNAWFIHAKSLWMDPHFSNEMDNRHKTNVANSNFLSATPRTLTLWTNLWIWDFVNCQVRKRQNRWEQIWYSAYLLLHLHQGERAAATDETFHISSRDRRRISSVADQSCFAFPTPGGGKGGQTWLDFTWQTTEVLDQLKIKNLWCK